MYGEDHMWTYQGYRMRFAAVALIFYTTHKYSVAVECHCKKYT